MQQKLIKYLSVILLVTFICCDTKIDEEFIETIENLTILQRLEQEDEFSMFLEMTLAAGFDNAFNASIG